ncbi:MAG: hypothetical protein ACP5T0_03060 [Verrucomicrobiia bacterium]
MKQNNKKRFLLRIDQSLWNDILSWANEDSRSINNQIEHILKMAVQKKKQKSLDKSLGDNAQLLAAQALETNNSNNDFKNNNQPFPKNIDPPNESKDKDFWVGYDEIPD